MINSHLIASAGHGCTMNTCFSNLHTFDREHTNSKGVTQSGHKNCMVLGWGYFFLHQCPPHHHVHLREKDPDAGNLSSNQNVTSVAISVWLKSNFSCVNINIIGSVLEEEKKHFYKRKSKKQRIALKGF